MNKVIINGKEFVVIPVGRYKGYKKEQKEFIEWLKKKTPHK